MKPRFLMLLTTIFVFALLVLPVRLVAQGKQDHNNHKHHHYKLIDMGTLGGPQSFGDHGHGAANINNRGFAAGVADTSTANPFYPNFNPLMVVQQVGPNPYVFHAFVSNGGALVDLGSLPGANSSAASFVTENGLVAGQSLNGEIDPLTGWPEENAVLWRHGHLINLGTLGGYESGAGSVNSKGQVVGFSGNAIPEDPSISLLGLGTQTRAFVWEDGVMKDMGTLGGPDAFAPLNNEAGDAAGFSYTAAMVVDPFLWRKGKMTDLGSFGGSFSVPDALNNRGEVSGFSNLAGDAAAHAFFWSDGELTDIGTLGGSYGEATTLNDAGDAAGLATTSGDAALHAFLWKHGVLTDLGAVPNIDATCVGAFAINSQDQVTGQAVENNCNGPAQRAFLWEKGDMIDLNVFVPPDSDLTLLDVETINERGEMFGTASLPTGDSRAFLLIPCDENHPGVKGCDYNMMEVPAAVAQTVPAVSNASSRTLPQSLMRRTNRYHLPGLGASSEGINNKEGCEGQDTSVLVDDPAIIHHALGMCQVQYVKNTLTGECIGSLGNQCVGKFDPTNCPVGTKAKTPRTVTGLCPKRSDFLDTSTKCQAR